jgi:hypothetical protein
MTDKTSTVKVRFQVLVARSMKIAVFREDVTKAVSSSETSVNIYQTTRCNIPEDSHVHVT